MWINLFFRKLFRIKNQKLISRFVVIDTETTGLDLKKDKILSIGAVVVEQNHININERFECFIEQEYFNLESVRIHGIMKHGDQKKIAEKEALEYFLEFVKDDVIVGHHVCFDIRMINKTLVAHDYNKLKNKVLDTEFLYRKLKPFLGYPQQVKRLSLDDLCEDLQISRKGRHTASGDALITALAFMKIKKKLLNENIQKLNRYLYRC